ncbi:hypothetical protein LWI28_006153 [Acer negundo]|uniref:Uncharacterized protein n=1 Tax=Acer negundo TaxID=4023 RepID=A0AAD5IUW4_ACENE|nr:hypothetical protein LWI28_006153 [Acer negundo]
MTIVWNARGLRSAPAYRVLVGCGGGLCLFWTDRVGVDLLSFSRFHIDVRVTSHGLTVERLRGFYGHLEAAHRWHA